MNPLESQKRRIFSKRKKERSVAVLCAYTYMWGETLVMDSSRNGRRDRLEDEDEEEELFREPAKRIHHEGYMGAASSLQPPPQSRKRGIEALRTGVGARYPYDEGGYREGDGWGLPNNSVLDPDFECSGVAAVSAAGMPPQGKRNGVDYGEEQASCDFIAWGGGGDDNGGGGGGGGVNSGGGDGGIQGFGTSMMQIDQSSGRRARVESENDLILMSDNPYSKCNFLLRTLTLDRLGRMQRE